MPKKKLAVKKAGLANTAVEKIKDRELSGFAHKEMTRYAKAVNEERAVPEYHDGLKPVQRRVLYAALNAGFRHSKAVEKSARLVGETLGKFHPHGDTACYDAVVNMVNMRYPLLDGEGNFGDFFDRKGFAAMRYTNIRLSKFSERIFFDPFYMPLVKYVANYDDKDREPLYLCGLLPNVLFNTTFAIGVGVTAEFPRFTMESVIALLTRVFKGEEPTSKLCREVLEFTTQYEGHLAPGQNKEVLTFFNEGRGRLKYESRYEIVAEERKIVFTGFAPFSNFTTRAEKVAAMAEVKAVSDESEKGQKIGRWAVYVKPEIDAKTLPQVAKKIARALDEQVSFFSNITIRSLKKESPDEYEVTLRSTTIPQLVAKWAAFRVKLEVSACAYQIQIKDQEIRKIDVMRLAVANRSQIIKALDKKLDDEALALHISKMLKISVDEAKFILDLRVRQLKALEDQKLLAEKKRLQELRTQYKVRHDKPAVYCAQHVQALLKELKT